MNNETSRPRLLRGCHRFAWLCLAALLPVGLLLTIGVASGTARASVIDSMTLAGEPQNEPLVLHKAAEPEVIYAGELVTYTFTISNSGAVSLTELILHDDHLGLIGHDLDYLEPDATATLTVPWPVYESITNLATITGTLFGTSEMVSATAVASVQVITPSLAFAVTAEPELIISGAEVEFSYVVSNTGNVTLTDLTIASTLFGSVGAPPFVLEPDETRIFTRTINLALTSTEVATVTAHHPLGLVQAGDDATVTVIAPAIVISKTAEPTVVLSGETVTYTYHIVNTGDVTLTEITVVDDILGMVGQPFELLPGAAETRILTAIIDSSVTNVATVTAHHPLGTVQDSDTAGVAVIQPAMQLRKTVTPTVVLSGETVTYAFRVTNSGDVLLTGIVIVDDHLGQVGLPFDLAPGLSLTRTQTATITETVTNVATATGHHPRGTVQDSDSATVMVIGPAIQLSKTAAPTTIISGETVTYTFYITNSGNITLTSVTLFDDHLGHVGTPFTLAPNAAVTLVQTATPRLDVTNVATVTGSHPRGTVSAQAAAFVKVNHRVYLPAIMNDYPSWQQVGNKPAAVTRFYDVAVCGDRFLAGTNAGLYRLQGSQWLRETAVPDSHVVNRLTFAGNDCSTAYVTTLGSGLWFGRFSNGWQWQRVDGGTDLTAAVVVRGNTVFAGTNSGVQWATVPATGHNHNWQSVNLNGLVLGLTLLPGSDTIFAAVWTKGVFANSGDPASWTPVGVMPNLLVYEAVGSALATPYLAGSLGGLYHWQSGNWAAVPGTAGRATFAVAAGNNRLYAGLQELGVLVSSDGGASWSTMNHGLQMPAGEEFQVRAFFVSAAGDYLYAATTSGVWRWPAP
jgi:uncharacterized repeat protein (TIGR01451 family)